MSDGELTGVLNLVHDGLDHSRFAFTVLAHECYLLASFDHEGSVVEDVVFGLEWLGVACTHIVANHRIGAAARRWWELQAESRCVFLIDLDQFEFLKPLDLALHLIGLGIGALESLDKLLCLGNLLLLILVLLLLLCTAFLAKLKIMRVSGLVVVDAAESDLDGAGGDGIDKLAVVADEHHCHWAVVDELLEPAY